MADRVTRWISYCSVGNLVQRKTIARVANPTSDHMTGSDIPDLDVLAAVKLPTMLNCVQKHLAKSHTNDMPLGLGKFGELIQKLKNSVGCL
jgi:hypothetical protein